MSEEADLLEASALFPEEVTVEQVKWWVAHHRPPYGHVSSALIYKLAVSWLMQTAALSASRADAERLKAENERLSAVAKFWEEAFTKKP